jgi:hypothetical protein
MSLSNTCACHHLTALESHAVPPRTGTRHLECAEQWEEWGFGVVDSKHHTGHRFMMFCIRLERAVLCYAMLCCTLDAIVPPPH